MRRWVGALCLSSSGCDPYEISSYLAGSPYPHEDKHKAPSSAQLHPLSLMNFANRMQQCAWPRPVGTRGGCGEGWGPCACPGGNAIRPGSVRPDGHTPTRTSTRPPHPPNPSPCPYRRERLPPHFCIRLANIIRTRDASVPLDLISAFDWQKSSETMVKKRLEMRLHSGCAGEVTGQGLDIVWLRRVDLEHY